MNTPPVFLLSQYKLIIFLSRTVNQRWSTHAYQTITSFCSRSVSLAVCVAIDVAMRWTNSACFVCISVVASVVVFFICFIPTFTEPAATMLRQLISATIPNTSTATRTPIPVQCTDMINRRQKKMQPAAAVTPPWIDLVDRAGVINDKIQSNLTSGIRSPGASPFYVHVLDAHTRRLGNQLFNYASLFGIAWRNRFIPLWPDRRTQLGDAFNLRIPVDKNNTVINVSHFKVQFVSYKV